MMAGYHRNYYSAMAQTHFYVGEFLFNLKNFNQPNPLDVR